MQLGGEVPLRCARGVEASGHWLVVGKKDVVDGVGTLVASSPLLRVE